MIDHSQMLDQVTKTLDQSFTQDTMKGREIKGAIVRFWKTSHLHVKLCLTHSTKLTGDRSFVDLQLVVEDPTRLGLFMRLGDRNPIHRLDWERELASKVSRSGVGSDRYSKGDVLTYAKELAAKLA